jgi:5-hydroxyisourate hydrolase
VANDGRPTISTHVLDTGAGRPLAGVRVICSLLEGDRVQAAGGGVTNDDGRITDVLEGRDLVPGVYRLSFELGPERFFEAATLDVRIEDAARSYHVPLLIAPFGLTSYRGS